MQTPDFGGYATKNNIVCEDGRTIRQDAFKHQDGMTVPLAWMHNSSDPSTILGVAKLENREDGVYANCYLNKSANAEIAKDLIKHGAVKALSIYANKLGQIGKDVRSGVIKEVSLVMGGSNPGAFIDTVSFAHGDFDDDSIDEAYITSGELIIMHSEEASKEVEEVKETEEVLEHAEVEVKEEEETDESVGDILATLNDKQKAAVGYLLEEVATAEDTDEELKQSEEDTHMVKRNVFDQNGETVEEANYLSHEDFAAITETAKAMGGSLKEAFLRHAEETGLELKHAGGTAAGYGIQSIDYMFPDARNVTTTPTFIQRDQGWVNKVMTGTRHTPFSRIKSMHADITEDAARAKGYITGNRKKEEVFKLLKRTTTPTTIYKKQKLDRDDIVDIVDFDVVVWMKGEMRTMLNEELARAILIGDGRSAADEDKIDETHIRPIAFDDALYTIKKEIDTTTDTPADCIDAILRARADWKGTGSPSLYVSQKVLTDWLLIKDSLGYRIYKTKAELQDAMNVAEIVVVDVMTQSTAYDETHKIYAIMVNLNDYTVGADKGGEVNMFDDFDIDYNQQKYLMETRCSGALTVPYSAICFVTDTTGGALG